MDCILSRLSAAFYKNSFSFLEKFIFLQKRYRGYMPNISAASQNGVRAALQGGRPDAAVHIPLLCRGSGHRAISAADILTEAVEPLHSLTAGRISLGVQNTAALAGDDAAARAPPHRTSLPASHPVTSWKGNFFRSPGRWPLL